MVIDSSAIAAILFDEPEAGLFESLVANDPVRLMSAGTLIETGIIIESRLGEAGGRELDLWLHRTGVEIVAVDTLHVDMARRCWRRFGKGRHSAGLNYGDCFAYALAITYGEPLLFKGNDFSKTDVTACVQSAPT